jgi:hypothetical protein
MINQIPTLIVCGLPTVIITVVAAIIGSAYRRNLAKKIKEDDKRGRLKDFSDYKLARKIRLLAFIAMASIVGIVITVFLVAVKLLTFNSRLTIILYLLFLLLCIVAGLLLIKEVLDRLRQ